MRRRIAFPLAAGLLVAAMVPGPAAATVLPAGVLDQANLAHTTSTNPTPTIAQTFKAGKTGLLTGVLLYMSGAYILDISLVSTSAGLPDLSQFIAISNTATPPSTPDWVVFTFPLPQPVVKDTEYAIAMPAGAVRSYGGSVSGYADGVAYELLGSSWTPINPGTLDDFSFQTYVDPQTTTVAWDKASVTAGASTALTATETFVYPTYGGLQTDLRSGAAPNAPAAVYSVESVSLPSWFTPTSVDCTGATQIAVADCVLAKVTTPSTMSVTPDGNPIVLKVIGTASPGSVGTGTATAESCVQYPVIVPVVVAPAQSIGTCVDGHADIPVLGNGTPPPTDTGHSSQGSSGGSPGWLLILGLAGAAGAAALLAYRSRDLSR